MTYLIDIENLGKRYGDFALAGINLAVEPGTVVGFIGSNGAGKTTTLKAALGLIAADEGTVRQGPYRRGAGHLRLPRYLPRERRRHHRARRLCHLGRCALERACGPLPTGAP